MSEYQSYYRLLGVSTDASQAQIDDAFDVFTVQKHPSVIRRQLEDYTRQCSAKNTKPDPRKLEEFGRRHVDSKEQYRIVCQGYKILSNPTSRAQYNKSLPKEEDTAVNLSFSQNEILLGRVKKGDSVIDSFVITLVSGNVSKKRFELKHPDWVTCTFTDTNGGLPITVQIAVDTDQLPIGDMQGTIVFLVGKEEFHLPISVTVYDIAVPSGTVPSTVIGQVPSIAVNAEQPLPVTNGAAETVDIGPWRRKWIPIFVAVAIIIVLVQLLTPKPVDPFSQFCTRPVVDVSGLHVNVTDNGLFMYGKLSAIFLINGEPIDVAEIPSEIVVDTFVKTIFLTSVYVKTGDHAGETQNCDKSMFP